MIPLTDQDVAEFAELYFRTTGRRLPPARARLVAERLVELVARVRDLGLDPERFPNAAP
jgi:hypothetical protein